MCLQRKGAVEPKPFSNFVVFQDKLVRLVARVLTFKSQFAERAKAIEEQFGEATQALKRQQEAKFRQLEKLEATVVNVQGKQTQWRDRVKMKTDELAAVKATKSELEAQLSSLRTRAALSSPGEGNKQAALASRAGGLERRLATAQSQLTQAEERLADARVKYSEGEGKWAARIKELEMRCRQAEEKYKRERQGAKERVAEMNEQIKCVPREQVLGAALTLISPQAEGEGGRGGEPAARDRGARRREPGARRLSLCIVSEWLVCRRHCSVTSVTWAARYPYPLCSLSRPCIIIMCHSPFSPASRPARRRRRRPRWPSAASRPRPSAGPP
jgi:hypothetical protein